MVKIIHISGASGAGKTFLGNRLKQKFGNNICVKDLDDLRDEFIKIFYGSKKWTYIDTNEYQKHINKYIEKYIEKETKPLIFTGLNDNVFGKNKKLYYNIQSHHNYYIELDNLTILKQKYLRFLNRKQNNEILTNDLINDNDNFLKMFSITIKKECNLKRVIKLSDIWEKYYKSQNYKFMTSEDIYNDVNNLLNSEINLI
jgi:adenylate kinase family enzyme